jgi:hypothetical protein
MNSIWKNLGTDFEVFLEGADILEREIVIKVIVTDLLKLKYTDLF